MEAKGEAASMLNRRCVVVRWQDLTLDKFLDLIDRGAGAILVLLPIYNTTLVDKETLNVSISISSPIMSLLIRIVSFPSHGRNWN